MLDKNLRILINKIYNYLVNLLIGNINKYKQIFICVGYLIIYQIKIKKIKN